MGLPEPAPVTVTTGTEDQVASFTLPASCHDDSSISPNGSIDLESDNAATAVSSGMQKLCSFTITETIDAQLHRAQANLAAHHAYILALLEGSLQRHSAKQEDDRQMLFSPLDAKQVPDKTSMSNLPGTPFEALKEHAADAHRKAARTSNSGDETSMRDVMAIVPTANGLAPLPNASKKVVISDPAMSSDALGTSSIAWEALDTIQPLPPPKNSKMDIGTHSITSVSSKTGERDFTTVIAKTSVETHKFEVFPAWKKKETNSKPLNWMMRNANVSSLLNVRVEDNDSEADLRATDADVEESIFLNPNSIKRFVWDLTSLMLVLYDMAVIPLSFFDIEENFFFAFCAWITRIFWTVDIFTSFATGYFRADGSIEMSLPKIARRYILTWLCLDLSLVVIDWFEVVVHEMGGFGAQLLKSSRTLRIIRLVRLLRLVRIQAVLQQLAENVHSEKMLVVLDVAKMVVLIMGQAHLVACIWYGIGVMDTADTWVRIYEYDAEPVGYRYLTSLHWSLSQFAGGMDEVTACNAVERVYVVFIFIVSFIVAAIFVSHITSSMTQLHMIASQQTLQLSILRRYFTQNSISKRLAVRVLVAARQAAAEKQRFMPESSVDLLHLVSEPLRVELHFEIFSPILGVHDFFKTYIEQCPQVMRKVCHSAISMSGVSQGDIIFHLGEIPSTPIMYFVVSGDLKYSASHGGIEHVGHGDWLAEATLWTPWTHRGNLESVADSRLCCIDSKKFQEIVTQFEHVQFCPRGHAAEFVDSLNKKIEDGDSLTDLDQHPFFSHSQKKRTLSTIELVGKHSTMDKLIKTFSRVGTQSMQTIPD